VGIPPVLHLGSCVDNSRILLAATEVVKAGGLGKDICDLPAAGSAPEWMSEKAISIGHYFVASGVYTVFGVHLPTSGAPVFQDYLFKEMEKMYGGKWDLEADPIKHAQDDRPHRQEAQRAGHRQGQRAGPHGYGRPPETGSLIEIQPNPQRRRKGKCLRLVAFAAIQGGYNIVSKVEGKLEKALGDLQCRHQGRVSQHGLLPAGDLLAAGMKVETLEDLKKPLEFARKLLPPHVKGKNHLPYLGPLLDAGMAAIFCLRDRGSHAHT
jgi:hypothetical protein